MAEFFKNYEPPRNAWLGVTVEDKKHGLPRLDLLRQVPAFIRFELRAYKHHRRSIRLKGYDYSQAGAYFVTICTQDRECLFGDIVDGEMRLNDAGQMVHRIWNDLSVEYPDIEIDEFIVMPNHFHGIIVIVGAPLVGARFCPARNAPHNRKQGRHKTCPYHWGMLSVRFKSITTTSICEMASDRKIGRHSTANYGSAIIMSTSFAVKKK